MLKIPLYNNSKIKISQVKINKISQSNIYMRQNNDANSIILLSDSIKKYGILHPLIIRRAKERYGHKFELIAGKRRLIAAEEIGLTYVPCIIVSADDALCLEISFAENLFRESLNIFEQAKALQRLCSIYKISPEDISEKISISPSAIASKISLLEFSHREQEIILATNLSERQALTLLTIQNKEERLKKLILLSKSRDNTVL